MLSSASPPERDWDVVNPLLDGPCFRVVSYNVLSDTLLFENVGLYPNCPQWALDFQYRKTNLARELITSEADIICLQEVDYHHYKEVFLPELEAYGKSTLANRRSETPPLFTGM